MKQKLIDLYPDGYCDGDGGESYQGSLPRAVPWEEEDNPVKYCHYTFGPQKEHPPGKSDIGI